MTSYSPQRADGNTDYNYCNKAVVDMYEDGKIGIGKDAGVMTVNFNASPVTITDSSFSAYVSDNTVLGTAQADSNGNASVQLSELASNTVNYWYADVVNEESGQAISAVQSFTTKKILGDVNGSRDVSIKDATALQLSIVGLTDAIPEGDLYCCDVDGSGDITIRDVTYIQMYLAKIIRKFPVE